MNGQFLFQVFEVFAEVLVGFAEVVDRPACVEHVAWSLPPQCNPMLAKEDLVIFLAKYIEI